MTVSLNFVKPGWAFDNPRTFARYSSPRFAAVLQQQLPKNSGELC